MLPIFEINSLQNLTDSEALQFPAKAKKKRDSVIQEEAGMDFLLLYSVVGKAHQVIVDRN